ncbi:MAG: rod shape-determining protein RodA [Ruminococcaceae bacterium]|nr:rod shape-determining protein RodA [Oscillospiraceae bacterium]
MKTLKKFFSSIGDYFINTDKILWFLVICCTVISSVLLSSVERAGGLFVRTQIMAACIGIIIAVIISVIDYEYITRYWWLLAILSIGLFIYVFLFGITISGTDDTAWIRLPGGLTFQPSELVKIFFIVTLAKHIDTLQSKGKLKTFLGVLSLLLHVGVPVVIIHMQGDDGSALIFFFIMLVMCIVAGVQGRYFIALGSILAIGLPLLWNFFLNDEHRNRILALFDLDSNALTNYGYQQYQSKVSIASGELTGYGVGQGYRTGVGFVPEQENDFIFSVAGEEMGFLGSILIILLLLLMIVKVFFIGLGARDKLGSYIAYGMFGLLASQTIVNLGMVLGLLPVIGITLPFFSAGGTSSMCLYFGIGLVQSVHMHKQNNEVIKLSYTRNERIKI